MPRDKDDPIRDYFEVDLPDRRFHEQNERLQEEIDGDLGSLGTRAMGAWKRDWEKMFGAAYPSTPATQEAFRSGIVSAYRALTDGGDGIPFVRWTGCLWHLLVGFRKESQTAVSECGDLFPVGESVEGKLETYPHQYLTCMKCWERVEAIEVATVLMQENVSPDE